MLHMEVILIAFGILILIALFFIYLELVSVHRENNDWLMEIDRELQKINMGFSSNLSVEDDLE